MAIEMLFRARDPLSQNFFLSRPRGTGLGISGRFSPRLMLLNGKPIEPGGRPNLNRILRKMMRA